MKKYLLLRDDRKSGPYSLEQLARMRLRPRDLLWIETESSKWKYAGELIECISLIKHKCTEAEKPDDRAQQQIDAQPMPSSAFAAVAATGMVHNNEEKDNKYAAPLLSGTIKHLRTSISLLALSLGVVLAVPVVKNIVEYNHANGSAALPVIDRQEYTRPGPDFKKTIVTEIVPVYMHHPVEEKQKTGATNEQQIKNTTCRVAAFDGINGIQLAVFNTSSDWVDKALVSLDYIQPNGDVLQSENLVFTSIKPHRSQTIDLPDSRPGVRLRCVLLKVYSHKYKPEERHI